MSNPRDALRYIEKRAAELETRVAELERKVEELLHLNNDSALKAVGINPSQPSGHPASGHIEFIGEDGKPKRMPVWDK